MLAEIHIKNHINFPGCLSSSIYIVKNTLKVDSLVTIPPAGVQTPVCEFTAVLRNEYNLYICLRTAKHFFLSE